MAPVSGVPPLPNSSPCVVRLAIWPSVPEASTQTPYCTKSA
jgi:hypothetical protein